MKFGRMRTHDAVRPAADPLRWVLHRTRSRLQRWCKMANKAILTSAEWLARADEARKLAGCLPDLSARETMLGIAAGYEKLARYAALTGADQPDDTHH